RRSRPDPLAVFQHELAVLVFGDRPGNAVGEQPVAHSLRRHDDLSFRGFSKGARDDPFVHPRWPWKSAISISLQVSPLASATGPERAVDHLPVCGRWAITHV